MKLDDERAASSKKAEESMDAAKEEREAMRKRMDAEREEVGGWGPGVVTRDRTASSSPLLSPQATAALAKERERCDAEEVAKRSMTARAEAAELLAEGLQAQVEEARLVSLRNSKLDADLTREAARSRKLHNRLQDLKGRIRIMVHWKWPRPPSVQPASARGAPSSPSPSPRYACGQ